MKKPVTMIFLFAVLLLSGCAIHSLVKESESIDILDLSPETVASITVASPGTDALLLNPVTAPVDPTEDIVYLVEMLNQIEVREAGKADAVFDYTITIYVRNGPNDADTYIENGWNPICICGDSICYDGTAYEVVAGDLQAVISRVDEMIAGGTYQ